jgi:hypothetical protein
LGAEREHGEHLGQTVTFHASDGRSDVTPSEWRAERQRQFEAIAWRADVVCAIEREWDDPEQSAAKVAAAIGITPRQLAAFLAWRGVAPGVEMRLRAWADTLDVPPVSLEYVALAALAWRLPSTERERAMGDLLRTVEMDAARYGVLDRALTIRPMGAGGRAPASAVAS